MFYNFITGLARGLLKHRICIEGAENIPQNGAAVLIANHRHAFDPIAMGLVTKRPVHFLAKKELFSKKFSRWFLLKLLCIPIDRENMDRTAIRESVNVLEQGGFLGVFPEGTRSHTGELLPFKSGVSFIASQSACVIVPMAIENSERIFSLFGPKVRVKIGTPFPYEALAGEKRRQTLERMTHKQEDAVRALLHQP